MSKQLNKKLEADVTIDLEKRKFIGKCGKYAVGAGMATLMTPTVSSAISSCNNGWGNGDQCAPGNSLPNNDAENNTFGDTQLNFGEPNPN